MTGTRNDPACRPDAIRRNHAEGFFNVIGVIVLLLLLRKLIWCLRWLWCWKHDRETPPPIGWLPSRDGGRFDAHMQKRDGEG